MVASNLSASAVAVGIELDSNNHLNQLFIEEPEDEKLITMIDRGKSNISSFLCVCS